MVQSYFVPWQTLCRTLVTTLHLTYEMKPPCLNIEIHNPYIIGNLSCFQLTNKGEWSPKAWLALSSSMSPSSLNNSTKKNPV